MKKLFSFLAAALFAGSMMAEPTTVYFWDGNQKNSETYSQTGGTAATVGDAGNVVGAASKLNWCLKLGKSYSSGANYIKITLSEPLQGGETISTGCFVTGSSRPDKDLVYGINYAGADEQTLTYYTDPEKDQEIPYISTNVAPDDLTLTVPASAAGKSEIRIYRKSGGTTLYVSKFLVTRPEVTKDTVFFVNKDAWEAVKFYAWGGTGAKITWPGLDMQKADYQLQDADVYYFVAEQGAYPNCIFNNANGAQTADLTWTAGKYYYEGSWYTRAELEEPVQSATYFLVGSFNNWKLDTALPMYDDEITVEWAAGAYEFKVVKDRSWDGALGYSDVDAECSDGGYEQNGTNVKVVLPEDGEVTVAVTEEGKLCLTGDFGGTIVVSTWTIVGVEALMGSNWDVNDPANEMTEVDDLWTLTKMHVRMTAGTEYKYKLVGDHSYSVFQYPVEGDQVLTVAEDGKYDVTFTWDEEDTLTATAVPSITTALENNTRVNVSKVLVDGQMLIEVDGVRYNVVGVRF